MPIFMDVHIVPGVKAKDVAEAHRKDLLHQEEHGCNCMTYWIDEERENIFCLIEAPNKEAVELMHNNAHGLLPNKIIEVNTNLVHSFLGRIYDPKEAEITEEGLKVFVDPSFRVIMVIKSIDPVILNHNLGIEKVTKLLTSYNELIRKKISFYGGTEVEHESDGFIISFKSGSKALACALGIQTTISQGEAKLLGFSITINAGEPIQNSHLLFGDTIRFATGICCFMDPSKITITSKIKEMVSKDLLPSGNNSFLFLNPKDENLLLMLFQKLEENWKDPEFDLNQYSQAMAMSTSALYRKTISLTGLSPNLLLKDFRLEKAKEMMKKRQFSISQVTYEAGFSSASYFTKCFKGKYGLLPMKYLEGIV